MHYTNFNKFLFTLHRGIITMYDKNKNALSTKKYPSLTSVQMIKMIEKYNHKNNFALLVYNLVEKRNKLQYHLGGINDYDTLTIDLLPDTELLYSSNEEYPYEVSELYAFTDYDFKRKKIKLFKTQKAAINDLINRYYIYNRKIA